MQNVQNQTKAEWLDPGKPDALGTGIFVIPDVRSDQPLAVRKEFVPDLTYLQCVQRGLLTLVFKWVPHSVKSFSELQQQSCGQQCVDTCVEFGCTCVNGKCM